MAESSATSSLRKWESSRHGAQRVASVNDNESTGGQSIASRQHWNAGEGSQLFASRGQDEGSLRTSGTNNKTRDPVQVRDVGITQLYSPENENDTVADVVFVHGLQGHPQRTWSTKAEEKKKRGFFKAMIGKKAPTNELEAFYWPEALLPEDQMDVRILTYGYDSNITAGLTQPNSKSGIFEHGNSFLQALTRIRQTGRPLFLIAHSLGGLVVKQGLIEAKKYSKRTEAQLYDIYKSTCAVIFLETPHRGSNLAHWGSILSSIAGAVQLDANTKVLKDLEPSVTSKLRELILDFNDVLEDDSRQKLKLFTFQEELGMTGIKLLGGKVVPDESSSFDSRGYGHDTIHANHMSMCRFKSRKDDGYEKIQAKLAQYIAAIKDEKTRLQEEARPKSSV